MELLHLLCVTLMQIDEELQETDEEYQTMRNKRNELEKELVQSMTRKQRALFHEYRKQREDLAMLELRRILSRCAISIPLRI